MRTWAMRLTARAPPLSLSRQAASVASPLRRSCVGRSEELQQDQVARVCDALRGVSWMSGPAARLGSAGRPDGDASHSAAARTAALAGASGGGAPSALRAAAATSAGSLDRGRRTTSSRRHGQRQRRARNSGVDEDRRGEADGRCGDQRGGERAGRWLEQRRETLTRRLVQSAHSLLLTARCVSMLARSCCAGGWAVRAVVVECAGVCAGAVVVVSGWMGGTVVCFFFPFPFPFLSFPRTAAPLLSICLRPDAPDQTDADGHISRSMATDAGGREEKSRAATRSEKKSRPLTLRPQRQHDNTQ